MVWEAIKFTGIAGAIFGALSYSYSRVPFMVFVLGAILLMVAFVNNIEFVQKEY